VTGLDPDPRLPDHDDGPAYVDQPATPSPYGREDGSGSCLWTAAMVLFWLVVAIFVASAPRSAATAIPAGDAKETAPRAPASSGNLSLPSEAPRSGMPAVSAGAASRVAPALVGEVGASLSSPAAGSTTSPATQLSDGGAIEGGLATWCAPTPTQCRRWGGHALLGAMPSFRWGDPSYFVRVRYRGHQVIVRVVSFCACGHGRVIDLSPFAFRQLAPTSRGVIPVSVEWLR
jgi:hypothetical protein